MVTPINSDFSYLEGAAMSNQLPSKEVLSQEESEAKQAVMKYMSGEDGLSVFTERLMSTAI
jgi:hypothetical protein